MNSDASAELDSPELFSCFAFLNPKSNKLCIPCEGLFTFCLLSAMLSQKPQSATIGTFDCSNDKTISNTLSVNRFPFIKPGTPVELAVFFLIVLGTGQKPGKLGKMHRFF